MVAVAAVVLGVADADDALATSKHAQLEAVAVENCLCYLQCR